MFVRVRQSASRLQLSLVETRRDGGRVRHEHVASLGSIRLLLSAADRIKFWTRLHQRLAKLGNRIDAATHGKILASLHARIPMPTPDDQRAAQLENAKSDTQFWNAMHDLQAEMAEGQKQLLANAERDIATSKKAAADAAAKAEAARNRLARIEKGEDVPGVGKPLTRKDVLAATGWTESKLRQAERMSQLDEASFEELLAEVENRRRLAEKSAIRAVLKRRLGTA